MILFSIIIPVFNAAKYLEPCIASVMTQNYPTDNYEVICIDDGSSDGSSDMLDSLAESYPNLRIYHQDNAGVSAARNKGIAYAVGEYLWFVDADDLVAPDSLPMLYRLVYDSEEKPDRIKFGSWACYEDITYEECVKIREKTTLPNYDYGNGVVWNCIINRQFLLQNNITFLETASYAEDNLFIMTILARCVHNKTVQDILYFHRSNPNSLMHVRTKESEMVRINSSIEVAKALRLLKSENCDYKKINRMIGYQVLKALSGIIELPRLEQRIYLNRMKKAGFFPCTIPQDSINKQIFAGRTDAAIYTFLYCHLNTRWGFLSMKVYRKLLELKRKLFR